MPTRNVSLRKELDHFVASKVKTGRDENASEVRIGQGRHVIFYRVTRNGVVVAGCLSLSEDCLISGCARHASDRASGRDGCVR